MKKQFLCCVAILALTGCNTTGTGTSAANKTAKKSMTTIVLEENCKNDEFILIESKYLFGNSDVLKKYGCKYNTKLTKHVFIDGKMKEIQAPSRDGKTYTKKELNELVATDQSVGFGKVLSETKTTIQR
ncbi:MAG: hypothetical protein COA45_12385 [Zetaproteobacteria bacterium]|nr:MAG: hypothetical protein COA45_12385 [Zetaproteobacteria bacterium]